MSNEELISCQICGETTHMIAQHLGKHEGWDLEKYQATYPHAPIMSERAKNALAAQQTKAAGAAPKSEVVAVTRARDAEQKEAFHELFGFSASDKEAMSARGTPIMIRTYAKDELDPRAAELVPEKDPDYVFDTGLTKTVVMALAMNIPCYLHGHAGVGKSTLYEQVAHHTGRPYVRVQHTANMEEADVEGRWIVNAKGEMEFQNGPLTDAMEQGCVYVADEYDFAPPMVLSAYQAVLEGKPLFIKAANKKVTPHPNFRFVASGNTNGQGDESGLYQGTMVQNAANYERFGVVEKVNYMPKSSEVSILTRKTAIAKGDAEKIVDFATRMREAFDKADVAIPMSPRATLNAAKLGMARNDFKFGIKVAYINRLPSTSADAATATLQRVFG